MFCDHVNRFPAEELFLLSDGFVLCPRCAAPCRGCDTPFRVEDLDDIGLCPLCSSGGRALNCES